MAYAALIQDFHGGPVSVKTLPETESHDAMRRMALAYGRSKGVETRRRNAGSSLTLYIVTIDAQGIATDLDRLVGDEWRYCAGNRHVHARRTWDLSATRPLAA